MKKLLSLVLAVVMLLGCMSITAFAAEILTEVNFTLSEYVDENTAMTITVSTEETANFSKTKFDGFLCVDGNSTYTREYNEGNGFTPASFDNWDKLVGDGAETPELDGSTMFAMFNLTTENKEVIDHEATVIKNGGTVVPNIAAYVAAGDQTEMLNFMTAPTDSFWNYNETELTVFIKLFGPAPTSGSTDITATVANSLSYDMVIPSAVSMTEAGVQEIGTPSVENVKHATEKTVISYTASGTNFKLSTDEGKTMTATYYSAYTDASTNTVLDSTKAIEVYKNSAPVDPLTKLYVGISESAWNAAENGTYTATVTYNFSAEEKAELPATMTITEMLATVKDFPTNSSLVKWMSIDGFELYISDNNLCAVDATIGLDSAVNKTDNNKYQLVKTTSDGTATTTNTFTFTLTGGVLTEVNLEQVIKMGGTMIDYGTYSFHAEGPVTVADVLSGITTFTPAYGSDASATVTFGSNTLTIKNGSQATIAEISGDTVLGAQYAKKYYAAGGIDGNKLTFWMNHGSLEYISVETSTDSTLARFFCSGASN